MSLTRSLSLLLLLVLICRASAQEALKMPRDGELLLEKVKQVLRQAEERCKETEKLADGYKQLARQSEERAREMTALAEHYKLLGKEEGERGKEAQQLFQKYQQLAREASEVQKQAERSAEASKLLARQANEQRIAAAKALVHAQFDHYRFWSSEDPYAAVFGSAGLVADAQALQEEKLADSLLQQVETWLATRPRLRTILPGTLTGMSPDRTKWVLQLPSKKDAKVDTRWTATVQLFDPATGKELGPEVVLNYQGRTSIHSMAVSPDSKTIATGFEDNNFSLWNAETGMQRGRPIPHFDTTTGLVPRPAYRGVIVVAFSADGKTLLTASGDQTARLWDVAKMTPLHKPMDHYGGGMTAALFSPDGKTILGSAHGIAVLWDAQSGNRLLPHLIHQGAVRGIAFSPDSKTLLTATSTPGRAGLPNVAAAHLWDAATGKRIGQPMEHKLPVDAIAFAPDGKTVLTGSEDKTAQLWDAATGKPVGPALQHDNWVAGVAYSRDGKILLTHDHKAAHLWEAATGRKIAALTHPDGIVTAGFSPDGTLYTQGSKDGLRLWDLGPIQRVAPPHTDPALVQLRVQVLTGLVREPNGVLRVIDPETWQKGRQRLQEVAAPPKKD
jgi:WD40 repeat protein